jgi:hypothetical protein
MRTLNIKHLLLIPVIAMVMFLQGCTVGATGGQAFLHGFEYCNIGTQSLDYIKIEYGEVRPTEVKFIKKRAGGDINCIDRSGTTAHMPVPVNMRVVWETTDGKRNSATIPIRSLVTSKHPITSFQVRFNDEHVQVYQTNVTLEVRQYTMIFEQ